MTAVKNWAVTITGDRSIAEVADDLAKIGLHAPQILEAIGTITGSAEESVAPKLRKVRGVASVEEEASIQIGPPGSKTTW